MAEQMRRNQPARPPGDFLRPSRAKACSRQLRKRFEIGLPIRVDEDGRVSDYPATFVGLHVGHSVWVTGKHEKFALNAQGFFGKGMLSKAEPMFDHTVRQLNMRRAPVTTTERQLQRKLNRERMREKRKRRAQKQRTAAVASAAVAPVAMAGEDDVDQFLDLAVLSSGGAARGDDLEDEQRADEQPQQDEEREAEQPQEDDADDNDDDNDDDQQDDQQDDNDQQDDQQDDNDQQDDHEEQEAQGGPAVPARKRYTKTDEFLQLGLEEAFFLQYGLGCLRVKRDPKDTIPLTIQHCWTSFCANSKGFPVSYAAYHHLRSKGWVPKSGLKYGVDWVIYKQGPVFYHSDFSVIVFPSYASPGQGRVPDDVGSSPHYPLNWQLLSNLNRVSGQVVKDILLLHVILPDGLTLADCATPDVLRRFQIKELPLRRWVPERDR